MMKAEKEQCFCTGVVESGAVRDFMWVVDFMCENRGMSCRASCASVRDLDVILNVQEATFTVDLYLRYSVVWKCWREATLRIGRSLQ